MSNAAHLPQESTSEPRLLADRAYEALRDRIVTLQIKPGDPLEEERLGRELGIGRTPLREAIKRLALEQLVTVFPRRGTFASEITITDLAHISDVRTAIEGHAAERAAALLTASQRPQLESLLTQLEQSRPVTDQAELMALDARVHRFIYHCAGNPYLADTCDRYFNLSLRIWHLALDHMPDLPEHVSEHREILNAIAEGDGDRARRAIAAHVETFARGIRAVL